MSTAPMTIKQLADRTGISIQYANDIVKGRRNLSRNPTLRKQIAAELNVPQHWIEEAS